MRKLVANASVLLSGGLVVSLLGVVSVVLVARQLGPETFGIFALLTSTVLVIDRLVNFQSWQGVVRFGSQLDKEAGQGGNPEAVSQLILGCFFFDLATALLGAVLGSACLYLLGGWMDWGADLQFSGALFGLVVGSKVSGTALGVFRLLEDYWGQVYVQSGASCLKVGLVLWGVFNGWGINGFLAAWAVSEIVMHLGLTILAFYRYRSRRGLSVFGHGARLKRGVVRFMVWTNLAVAADLPAKELDVVLVGLLAGEREAGFYKIAKQGMALVGKVSSPLYQAIYPVQAKMLAGEDRRGAIGITFKAASLLLLVSLVLVTVAWPILPLAVPFVLGGEYGAVWSLFLFAVVVKSLDNIFTTVHSLFVAMGYVRANLVILLAANGVMLAGFWLFVPDFGAFGALSCLTAQAVLVLLMKVLFISSAGKR